MLRIPSCFALGRRIGDQRGATMIEGTLVLLLFLFVFLFFTDCARYLMTRSLLIRGAQDAVDLATRVPHFDIDLRNEPTGGSTNTARFLAARASVENSALTGGAFSTLISPSSSGGGLIRLRQFTQADNYSNGELNPVSDVMILRPGESASSGSGWYHHPDRCAVGHAADGCASPLIPRATEDSMQTLLRDYPIIVRMEADLQTIIPFMGPWLVRATAVGWREQSARSGFRDASFSALPRVTPPPPSTPGPDTRPNLDDCESNPSFHPSCANCVVDNEAGCTSRGQWVLQCFGLGNTCCMCQAPGDGGGF